MYQNLLFIPTDSAGAAALRIGLANHVVPSSELPFTSEALAKKIMALAPQAVRFCMTAVHLGLEAILEQGQVQEARLVGMCCVTDGMREGSKAFLEKRAPDFKGR